MHVIHVKFKTFYWRCHQIALISCITTYFFVFRLLILYFSGLSYGTDEQSLKEAFAKYGEVVEGVLYLSHV